MARATGGCQDDAQGSSPLSGRQERALARLLSRGFFVDERRPTSGSAVGSSVTHKYGGREAGKPAFALMADRGTGRYVGSAFINARDAIRDRLWKRVQEHAGPPPKGTKRPATQWVKPGIIGRVKHLRGEDDLRHASLQDFRDFLYH